VENGRFTHMGLPVVTFTRKGVLMKVNGSGMVFIETQGSRHSCMEIYHQHGS
jgi:hypothetical protein